MMELEDFDASIVARAKPIQTTPTSTEANQTFMVEANQGAAISGGVMKDKIVAKNLGYDAAGLREYRNIASDLAEEKKCLQEK